ncbi:MAG: phenylalanine--tRNA ligase subunit beta [Candidatus Magnetominusculus sp. LBB02]|nr:phenylalanine--tRNA ligase subunit beta [Candidatus Magnetominusculus sp. LBB02]
MLISYNWLKDYIDFDNSAGEIAEILTMSGLEVESFNRQDNGDVIMELNVTPNRADCLSVIGVARDVAAILKKTLKLPETGDFGNATDTGFKVEIIDAALCHRYCGIVISGVKVTPSPEWMRDRLEHSGIRPINNIVDITNYVLLEFGQPLHAFDLSRLKGNKIIVKAADRPQMIATLDGIERTVAAGTLLICDADGPVALAGVMGGKDSAVTETTTDILLESAWFSPASIRVTSKLTGLRSESSFRFERTTDIDGVKNAALRAASLMAAHSGGLISEVIDNYPNRYAARPIAMSCENVQKLLGVKIPEGQIVDILSRLGFTVERLPQNLLITPPSFRRDIELEADLIEEIARIYGYNNIPAVMPQLSLAINNVSDKHKKLAELRHSLRYAGFTETINYSFTSKDDLTLLNIPEGDQRRAAVTVKNPLQKDYNILRTFLLPSLLKNLKHNIAVGAKEVNIYEIGTVFFDTGDEFPKERLKLAVLSYSGKGKRLYNEPASQFYSMKGLLETISSVNYELRQSNEAFLDDGQSADICIGGGNEKVGFLGQVSAEIAARLDMIVDRPEIAVLEMFIEHEETKPMFKTSIITKYPPIERDIAIVVDDSCQSCDIINLIKDKRLDPGRLVEFVEIFDLYKGKNIPDGKKSLAYHIVYRSKERTLLESEVDALHAEIVNHVIGKTGGALRA